MQVQALPSGMITLTFGKKSDALSQEISALVLHLYNGQAKQEATTGKGPALAAVTEVSLSTHIKALAAVIEMSLKTQYQSVGCCHSGEPQHLHNMPTSLAWRVDVCLPAS